MSRDLFSFERIMLVLSERVLCESDNLGFGKDDVAPSIAGGNVFGGADLSSGLDADLGHDCCCCCCW
jgi:hypothetical protein